MGVQVRSLQLFKVHIAAALDAPPAHQTLVALSLSTVLPHLLAALSCRSADVRAAALELIQPTSAVVSIATHCPAGTTARLQSNASFAGCELA